MIKFSIILPCFNVGKYIEKCLLSIISNKGIEECEIILVDDGSTDNTLSIINRFINQCPNNIRKIFSVFSHENKGVSHARNFGLSHAIGDYILFVDPDDEIDNTLIVKLNEKIQEENSDLIFYGHWTICVDDEKVGTNKTLSLPLQKYELKSNKEVMKILFPKYIGYSVTQVKSWAKYGEFSPKPEWGACWRIAYKRSILSEHGIQFNEKIKMNEDSMFNANVFIYVNCVSTINEGLYYYYSRETGALKRMLSSNLISNKKELFYERKRIIDLTKGTNVEQNISSYAGSIVLGIIEMMASSSIKNYKEIHDIIVSPNIKDGIQCMPYVASLRFNICLFFLKHNLSKCLFTIIQILKILNIRIHI